MVTTLLSMFFTGALVLAIITLIACIADVFFPFLIICGVCLLLGFIVQEVAKVLF